MRKFVVILVSGEIAIEIVSNETLKSSDGMTFANEKEYFDYKYGDGNIVAFSEAGGENKPVKISVYKEGVFSTPTKEEQDKDYIVTYW